MTVTDAARRLTLGKFLGRIIGTGLGTGYSPLAPGTAGSFVAVLIWMALPPLTAGQQIALVGVGFLAGIPLCTSLEKDYGHDPHQATWDEFVGQWVSLFLLPRTLPWLAASFFIFRALDVWKPWPARGSQKLPGGLGVMVDDLIVGIYTVVLLHGVRLLL
jgi:phosphatidylglycerophosphatase A